MITISHIEWHVAHSCNLTCEGCAHFSNHGHKGIVTAAELAQWYSFWHKRINPLQIDLLGGEPLINKEIFDIIKLTRDMWSSEVRLITNGLLLHKFPNLPKVLKDNDCVLVISKHGDNAEYNSKMSEIVDLTNRWVRTYGIKVEFVDSYTNWMKMYKGYGDNMMPFEDQDPETSWNNCIAGQDCFQLLDGNIYKCAPLAYLPLQQQQFNLSSKWDHYLTYKPLTPGATDQEIADFFNRKAESYCAMCPANPSKFIKRNPLLPRRFYRLEQTND